MNHTLTCRQGIRKCGLCTAISLQVLATGSIVLSRDQRHVVLVPKYYLHTSYAGFSYIFCKLTYFRVVATN